MPAQWTRVSSPGGGAPDWAANTSYSGGQLLVAPDLTLIRTKAPHTSGAIYDPSLYTSLLGRQPAGYAEAVADQGPITAGTPLTGLQLPSLTVVAGGPTLCVEAYVPYWSAAAAGSQAALLLVDNTTASVYATTFSSKAGAVNDLLSGLRAFKRFTAPATYIMRAQGQGVGGGVTAKQSAADPSYIRAWWDG